MRTRIELGTSGSIELFEDIPISLTYSIADIRKPDVRQGSFTKTITIPGSKINDQLFGFIFDIGADCRFNANKKTPCRIYIDDIEQLSGFLRLIKINKTENKIEYECSVMGHVANMFTQLGDALLSDLDLSEYDHTYNKAAQKASWTATIGEGYVYPMIDYGYTDGTTYDVKHFYPAIYVKTYIVKIFEYAGFTYDSSFFDSTFFKRLIIPFNSNVLKLSDAEIQTRLFSADLGSSGSIAIPNTPGVYTNLYTTLIPFNNDVSDPSNQFNVTTNRFVASKVGSYNFFAQFDYQLNSSTAFAPTGLVAIIKYSAGYYTAIGTQNYATFGGITDALKTATVSASGVELLPGDEVYVGTTITATSTGTPNFNIATGGTFYNTVNNTGLFDGDSLSMTLAIPQKVKMKEFLMSIVKMFNLYLESDKENSNKYYIEPRNDFYSQGSTQVWQGWSGGKYVAKLDVGSKLEIEPMGALDARKYVFTYTDDKDYYNELYLKTWSETYGTKTLETENEFITGNSDSKVVFSATPLVNNGSSDRTIPAIFSTDSAGNITPKQSNIRILYYGGSISTLNSWTYTGVMSGTTTETTYPYAGHLDSTSSPTVDLSFATPKEVYYTALTYTNGNLYNKYYKQFIEEITDKDSKIITGMFNLTPSDILRLDFRDQYYVEPYFLRLNKIYDYNPIKQGLTKVEFIKIKDAQPFVPVVRPVYGGSLSAQFVNSDDYAPTTTFTKRPLGDKTGMRTTSNVVADGSEGVIISGANNMVSPGCKNISILNSSGCIVAPGVSGVTMINSSGVIAMDNDSFYLHGFLFTQEMMAKVRAL